MISAKTFSSAGVGKVSSDAFVSFRGQSSPVTLKGTPQLFADRAVKLQIRRLELRLAGGDELIELIDQLLRFTHVMFARKIVQLVFLRGNLRFMLVSGL
jgi:hypothetical protein